MSLTLQAVIVKKPCDLQQAKDIAKHFIKKKEFYSETDKKYTFRNFPKKQFEAKSFVSKNIKNDVSITLVFGKHKKNKEEIIQGGSLWETIRDGINRFLFKHNPLTNGIRDSFNKGLNKANAQ